MAPENIKIGINVVSNTDTETTKAIKLKKAYEEASRAAGSMGGTAGSRAVAAKAAPISSGGLSGQAYGTAQAASGMGSRARDFAKEAQGLGGLVRVYATFAANLFAVSAAFSALRDAASTTNIVKGLDQLGAASGRNLGTLATQLSAASDGAINLRDSMTAVAQASSGGLANKQILQLGEVAKKASEALGLSMPDALSRLSRGITKIEPELLDELGIFVKVDEASQKYALSIGKSAASLSDFEKRQAFANAVLDQGVKKFSDIKIDANPYDKLLASISNVATAGLQLVNTVLGPIAKILSESPGALAGVFALIGVTLLRQAIPALSQWRGELTKSAEASAASAKKSYEAFSEYSVVKAIAKELKQVGPLQKTFNNTISEAQTSLAKSLSSKSKILAQAMSGTADPEVMQKSLATELRRRETTLANLGATISAEVKAGTATADRLATYDQLSKKQKQDIINIRAASDAYISAAKIQKDITDIQVKSDSVGFEEKIRKVIAERAKNVAVSKGILAQVGSDTEMKGMSKAFSNLFDNIKSGIPAFDEFGKVVKDQDGKVTRATQGLTGFRAATTALSGSFLVVGDAVGKALSALGPYLQLFAVAVAAYEVFNSYASKAAKEQSDFNSKISEGEAAVKTVGNTFDNYIRKTKDAFSVEGISAFTTALAGVTDSLQSQLLSYDKFKEVAGTFDKLKDSLAGFFFFTESNLEKLQKSTVDSVKAVVKSLELSGKSTSAKGIIAEALFGKDASVDKLYGSTKDLNKAFDGLTDTQREEKIKKLSNAIDSVTISEQYSTNAANAFSESLSSVNKLVDQMIQANAFTDLQGKLGVDLVLASERLGQALADPVKSLAAIAKLGNDPKALAALSNVDVDQLKQAVILQKQINDAEKARADAISQQQKAIAGSGSRVSAINEQKGISFSTISGATIRNKIAAKQLDIGEADALVKETDVKFEQLKKQASDFSLSQISLVTKIAEAGFDKIEIGLKKAKELAALGVAKAETSVSASGGANVADRNYNIRAAELKIQETLINANYAVQLASIKNSQRLDELNTTLQLATAVQLKNSDKASDKAAGETMFTQASQRMLIISTANAIKSGGIEDALKSRSTTPEVLGAAKARNNEAEIAKKQAEAAIAGVRGQNQEALITRDAENRNEALRKTKETLDLDNQALNTRSESLSLATKILGYDSTALTIERQNVQQKLIKNDTEAKLAEIAKNRKDAIIGANAADILVADKRAKDRSKEVIDAANIKKYTTDITQIKEQSAAIQAETNFKSGIELQNLQTANSLVENRTNIEQKRLDAMSQMGMFDEKAIIALKAQAELELQKLKYQEQSATLAVDVEQKRLALQSAQDTQSKTKEFLDNNPTDIGALSNYASASTSVTNAQQAFDSSTSKQDAASQINAMVTESIKKQEELNQKFAEQKQYLADIAGIATFLGSTFGEVGTKIGGTLSILAEFGVKQKNAAEGIAEMGNKAAAAYKKASESDDSETRDKFIKEGSQAIDEQSRLQTKARKDEITGYAQIAGSAKSMFKEKTFAYKALDKVEKAMHLYRLAMDAKELAFKIGNAILGTTVKAGAEAAETGITFAGTAARLPAYAAEIYGKTIGQLGPIAGPAVATALVAAMFGMFGKGGGGGASAFVPTAEQRQETQGTAMGYNSSGEKVQVRRGVFGDTDAKSESIANSLEIIKNNSVDGLDYDNKMLRALTSVADSLDTAAKGLYRITGLRAGSLSGIVEGSNTSGGLLGIGGIFSKSTTKSIVDSGLQLKGTFLELANGVRGTINTFETVSTTVKKSGFLGIGGSTSTRVETFYKDLAGVDEKAFKSISKSFSAASDLLYDIASVAEVSADQVTATISSIQVDQLASLRGLSGENFTKELGAVIGAVLDDASLAIFSSFESYANFGEGMLETVVRVVDANKKIAQAVSNIGIGFDLTKAFYATEALANAAGGLDKFLDQVEYFRENFLTEAERLAPVQKAVSNQLKALGLSTDLTRKQFVKITQGLDLTLTSSANFYKSLMELAPGFIEVTAQVEKLNSKIYDFDISIYTELGNAEKALQLTREKELESLDDSLKPLQLYLNALKDESTLKAKIASTYKEQSAALKNTVTGLKNSIKTLKDYKTSLTASASSLLTPAEKYAQAKSTMLATASLARKVIDSASTADDIAARDAAVSRLSSTSETFLASSKEMFASSDSYTQDFKTVLELLDASDNALSAQVSDTEKQQIALDASVSFLNLISTSTDTTATLLAKLLTLQTATEIARQDAASAGSTAAAMSIPAMASGGVAKGLTLVGENWPELANFTSTARVYSNQASNDIFNTKELVAEIRSLKAEVSQLRADQKAQTGHLIAANYDANAKNAEAVAESTDAALVDQTWKQRSQVKIA